MPPRHNFRLFGYKTLLAAAVTMALAACVPTPAAESSVNEQPLPAALKESSGLSCYQGTLWSLNDSGNNPEVFQLNPTAQLLKQQRLKLKNQDWEALEWADDELWIADIGNNEGRRTELQLYRLNQELKPEKTVKVSLADSDNLPYQHDLDFEALVHWQQQLWLVSKSWQSAVARFYPVNRSLALQSLPTPSYQLELPFLVTDASPVPGTDQLLLVGYVAPQQRFWLSIQGKFEVWMALVDGKGKLLKQQQLPVDTQVEGACIDLAGQLWLSSEVGYKPATLYRLLHR